MDDMNAFDRQIADEFLRDAGPSELVDDDAIFTAIASAKPDRPRFGSLFSATKLVVAGSVVAVFGGLLLAGVLTQPDDDTLLPVGGSPSPTTRSDLLSGVDLSVDELEPGVYRVVSDGVRDLVDPYDPADERKHNNLVAGQDGSVWILDRDRFYRIGAADTYPSVLQTRLDPLSAPRPYVDPDGTLWVMAGPWWDVPRAELGRLFAFADGEWQVRHEGVAAFALQPDGTVWAMRDFLRERDDDYSTLERLDPDGWTVFEVGEPETVELWVGPGTQLSIDQDDVPEMVVDHLVKRDSGGGVWVGFEGNTPLWEALGDDVAFVDIGAGGDAWAYTEASVPVTGDGERTTEIVPYLISGSVDTGVAATYGPEHGVPLAADMVEGPDSMLRVDPAGRVWMVPERPDYACDGIASFDGERWTRHLRGLCIRAFDFSPNGATWVRANGAEALEDGAGPLPNYLGLRTHTYVITQEALAGAAETPLP